MLNWLDSDRVRAGEKYEEIRKSIIMIFTRRGSLDPEELADEVINRVAFKVEEIAATYVGDPARYFHGVAINVFRESLRKKTPTEIWPLGDSADEKEAKLSCLEQCLETIGQENREVILLYFQAQSTYKSDFRKELAAKMNITLNTLRMRVHRVRMELKECIKSCVDLRGV